MNDIQLTLIVLGLVALARRYVPKIDGVFVPLAAIFLATIAAFLAAPCSIGAGIARGIVSGFTAFGVRSAIRYAAHKLDRRCPARGNDDQAPVTLPTGAKSD